MVFFAINNILNALFDICCQRNKTDEKPLNKTYLIIQDMEDLANDEIDKIFKYHNKKYCC